MEPDVYTWRSHRTLRWPGNLFLGNNLQESHNLRYPFRSQFRSGFNHTLQDYFGRRWTVGGSAFLSWMSFPQLSFLFYHGLLRPPFCRRALAAAGHDLQYREAVFWFLASEVTNAAAYALQAEGVVATAVGLRDEELHVEEVAVRILPTRRRRTARPRRSTWCARATARRWPASPSASAPGARRTRGCGRPCARRGERSRSWAATRSA